MKREFKRFGLEKAGALTAGVEILGVFSLLLDLKFLMILLVSSLEWDINEFRCCSPDKNWILSGLLCQNYFLWC